MSSSSVRPPPQFAISSVGQKLPSRTIFYGVPGIGKTSMAAFAARPIFVMTHRENGLETLIDAGQLPPTDHFPEVNDWSTLLGALSWLLVNKTDHKTLVLDTLNGAQQLCFDSVTAAKFNNDPADFSAYGRGPEVALQEWSKLIGYLHRINFERRMSIICLAHCRTKTFKNPEGEDYDKYNTELHDKTWAVAEKWSDMILFANYQTWAKKERGAMKAKAVGGAQRVIHTQNSAAFVAKNRYGLPAQIPMGNGPKEAWDNLYRAVRDAKKAAEAQAAPVESVPVNSTETNGTPVNEEIPS